LSVRISIITVTRNAGAFIENCIKTVAAQTHPALEYIIIDGASTDGTQAIVERHRATVSQFISEPDDGLYDAMNKGIARATGEYILFLGADDRLYDREVMSDIARFLAAHGEADFVYGNIAVRSPDGCEVIFRPPPPEEALKFLICGCLPHQASFARRDIFERLGTFDLKYKISGDYDWFLRVVGSPDSRVRYVDRTVASYFADGLSNNLERSQAEAYAIQNAFPGYRSERWHLTRIAEFQRILLQHRIDLQRAERLLTELQVNPRAAQPLVRRLGSAVLARLPRPVADRVRRLRYLA
jgi:glycosyltransferase involved in cell wall biosynthesis